MNKRFCTVEHNPPHSYGDCVRACISTLIDRDDVPLPTDPTKPEESWDEFRAYLKTIGKFIALFPHEEPFGFMGVTNPNIYYLLMGKGRSDGHCVVCKNDQVVHDPSPTPIPLTGGLKVPDEDGQLHEVYIIGIIGDI